VTDSPEPDHPDRVAPVLHSILRLGAETTDIGALISRIRGLLGGLMDTTNFYVALFDPDTETYRFPFFADQHEDADPNVCEALPKSLTDYVRRTGKPALVDEDLHAELIERGEASMVGAASHQWMGVPLETGNGVIGVIALQSYDDPTLYSAKDLELLRSIAGTISVVVERNNAEQELRISRENLSLIFDTIGDVLFQLRVEGENSYRFGSVNSSFLRAAGLREDQVVGKPVEEVIPESARELIFGRFAQAIRERSTVTWQEASTCPTGDLTGIVSVTPSFDGYGTCTHLVGSVHDITDHVRAIDELKRSKDRLRSITESSADFIMLLDTEKRILFINRTVRDLKPEEIIGADIRDFTPPAMQKVADACFDRVAQTGSPSQYETDYVTKTGERRFFDVRIGPVIEDGELAGFVSSSTDVTNRREAETELQLKNHVFDVSLTANSTADDDGILNHVNSAFLRIWSLDDNAEAIGRPIGDFLESEVEATEILTALNQDGEWEGEFTALRGDGTTFLASSTATVIKNEEGHVVGYQSSVLDISERKRAEEALAEHREHLEHEILRRTADLREAVDLMAGREVRMAEMKDEERKRKDEVRELRKRLAKHEG